MTTRGPQSPKQQQPVESNNGQALEYQGLGFMFHGFWFGTEDMLDHLFDA
jgi:hypothetical protein